MKIKNYITSKFAHVKKCSDFYNLYLLLLTEKIMLEYAIIPVTFKYVQ